MKWIVRILGVLAGLLVLSLVTLFAMGHRADAGRMQTGIELNAPPEQVWSWLNEPEKLKQWVSWLVEVRAADPNRRGVGEKRVWVMRDENNGGQLMEIEGTCSEYAPPSRLSVALSSPGAFEGGQSYRLADLGSGRSRLEIESNYRFGMWFARLMEPLITPMAKKKMVGDLARLKSLVETH